MHKFARIGFLDKFKNNAEDQETDLNRVVFLSHQAKLIARAF